MSAMKKIFFIFMIFAIFVMTSSFSDGMLGLRTLEATETEQATEVLAETEEPGIDAGLNLRTVDPLLVSFREGFQTPVLPGWKEGKIGDITFKIPMGFSTEAVKNGVNYDGKIRDTNGKIFAQLFLYQLDSYQLEELFNTLLKTLYADRAMDEKKF